MQATHFVAKPKHAKPKAVPISPDAFRVTVLCNGIVYEGVGDSIVQALEQVNPQQFKTKAKVTVFHDGRQREVLVPSVQIRRALFSKLHREIFQKRLLNLLG